MISERASTVLATIGTVLWCIQLFPQLVRNFKTKNCEGFPPLFMFLWASCAIPFSVYFVSTRANIVVQIQPSCFQVLCLTAWVQSLWYPPVKMNKWKIFGFIAAYVVFAIALEVGFIFWLRRLHDQGTTWPTLIFGILASILLASGLIPPYLEIFKRKGEVVGINFIFIAIDMGGAFFSMLSVVVGNMDIMGIVLYCVCFCLELGILLSHFVWWLRFRAFNKNDVSDIESQVAEKQLRSEITTESCETLAVQETKVKGQVTACDLELAPTIDSIKA